MINEKIHAHFAESIQTSIVAAEALPELIEKAVMLLSKTLIKGNKILVCGNGGAAALAQIFASHLLNKYEKERPSLPAIAITADSALLSAIATDSHFNEIYAKQIAALSQDGDLLLVISHGGNSRNLIKAVETALSKNLQIIILNGVDGGELAGLLGSDDIEIRAPSDKGSRIEEIHLLVINCLSDLIDQELFPQQ
ncbi:DnaA-interacting protein DiaA [Psychromonas ingrahamii 37]|uniref:DnaA-interacting protein DiaA n=1 Tax=Psychromonas ingrahamii (strain DSM 17664 / CCUG 51855 / 37) TaxID=357804 RepID=A1SU46_PSYIN|nr:SIS domain-containing protein [Psychromonas ingrahamii]ABM03011.1 DnaA-interacting protein DiaA [Psychromonas ingrahamii 37]